MLRRRATGALAPWTGVRGFNLSAHVCAFPVEEHYSMPSLPSLSSFRAAPASCSSSRGFSESSGAIARPALLRVLLLPPCLLPSLSPSCLRRFGDDLRVIHAEEMPEGEFHRQADDCLDALAEAFDGFLEDNDVQGADVEYSQGVLTVKMGHKGTYVINKQTPNRQIWMSSPVSGPVRYDLTEGRWVYHRDGHELHARLRAEVTDLVGTPFEC